MKFLKAKSNLETNNLSWEKLKTLKDNTVLAVRWIKQGESFVQQVKQNNRWKDVLIISEAKNGEGVMNWSDYKKRTNTM